MTAPLLRRLIDSSSPGTRQLAAVTGMLLALVALVAVPNRGITEPFSAWGGVGLVLLATLAAVLLPWHEWSGNIQVAVPLLTMLGFGLFRAGTGGAQSLFGALIVLPVLWIAARPGRSWALVAAGASAVALMLPYLLGHTPWSDGDILRVVFAPIIYLVVAGVVNDLMTRSRNQLDEMLALVVDREAALQAEKSSLEALSEANQRLEASEEFSQSVWQSIREAAVVVTDLDGRIRAWGPGAELMLGLSPQQAEFRMALTEIVVPESVLGGTAGADTDPDQLFRELVEIAGRPGGAPDDIVLQDRTGGTVPVHLSCSPLRSGEGEPTGHLFIARDMSQTHEVARLKDEFVGAVSHELRTPLSSIMGYLELVRDEEETLSQDQKRFLAIAERNAQRLLDVVGDLLFVAQVDAGLLPLRPAPVDLCALVDAALESAMPAAARREVRLVGETDGGPVMVDGDAGRLGQAVDNLVSNALKFTPAGGTVTVSARSCPDGALIAVSDTGIGIPAAEMDKLFSRFFRSSTATQRAIQGIGLGLNITRAIVTAHGGRMSVSSVEGEGTTFRVHLPPQA